MKVKFVDVTGSRKPSSIVSKLGSPSQRSVAFETWFSFYHRESFSWNTDFETIDQPIATVLVVSSEDVSPTDCFEQLSHVANQPGLCRQGVLDPTSTRVRILVHNQNGPRTIQDADAIAQQISTIYPPQSVIFLPINSSPPPGDAEIYKLFSKHVVQNSVPITAGYSLSWDDIDRLNRAVEQVVTANAIPWMEKRIAQLDSTITAKRKGFRNQLKNFLRPVPDASTATSRSSSILTLQQVEWQCRLAGDLAFHLRHYELAYSYYRNIANDLKTDKYFSQSAGCYEMSGLCGILMPRGDVSLSEIVRFFDTAIEMYKLSACADACIRSAVFQSLALIGRPEAGEKLIKINGAIPDNGIRCAMLLDRAATLYGIAGMMRKESFTRVLAGHMFNKIDGMKPWALDCYSSVLARYDSPSWNHIVDHLLFTMAKIEFGLGRTDPATQYLVQLLRGVVENSSPATLPGTSEKHANYVKLLTYIGKARTETVGNVPLPIIALGHGGIVTLKNPLLVPIEITSLRIVTNTSHEYSMSLGPMEERDIPIVSEDPMTKIEWTLFNTFNCYINV
jgi:hypothetical protein